jgi:hypothetical protein
MQQMEVRDNTKHLQKSHLKIRDDEIKLKVQQKILTYKKYLQTKTIDNENE